jgi:hypothetical protein
LNSGYRFRLEKGSKKHHCPQCRKSRFVRYVDTETGNYLPSQYGRCDRESKCAYHLTPYADGYAKSLTDRNRESASHYPKAWNPKRYSKPKENPAEPVFFDFETFMRTLEPDRYDSNVFVQNLLSRVDYPFSVEDVTSVVQLYRLGTVSKGCRAGSTTFPFIDVKGQVRAIQVKQFDESNHTVSTDFLHSILERHHTQQGNCPPEWLKGYGGQEKKVSCLFGEHLLSKYPLNPVALVEAPKTAVYGTLYFGLPDSPEGLVWLAVYNKSSFSFDKLKALQGRDVIVFPDLSEDGSTFREWKAKATEFERQLSGTRFRFSDLLESLASDKLKEAGADIADILIRFDWRMFRLKDSRQGIPNPSTCHPADFVADPETVPESETWASPGLVIEPNTEERQTAEGEKGEKGEAPKTSFFSSHSDEWHSVESDLDEIKPEKPNQRREDWGQDLIELERFYSDTTLPTEPVRLNRHSVISDCPRFVDSHLTTLRLNEGNRTFEPYLSRLRELRTALTDTTASG